jgi:hypothetical protein
MKIFVANIIWGFLSGSMGYSILDLKGAIVFFVGIILVTILASDDW